MLEVVPQLPELPDSLEEVLPGRLVFPPWLFQGEMTTCEAGSRPRRASGEVGVAGSSCGKRSIRSGGSGGVGGGEDGGSNSGSGEDGDVDGDGGGMQLTLVTVRGRGRS